MKKIILPILLLTLSSCVNQSKTVYWCGDHPCINKKEKEEYFKKYMTVEKRILNKKDKAYLSEIEKITAQAEVNQKQKIQKDNEQNKLVKLKKKRRIKEEKRLKKEAKREEKIRLKKQRKMIKQLEIEEKKRKLKKKTKLESKQLVKSNKNKILSTDPEFKYNKFDDILEKITNRNSLREFPDINNIPN